MSASALAGTTALVTGASRGFGRGIATSLSWAGARVIGVARVPEQLRQLRSELGDSFIPAAADATAPATAGQLIDATPAMTRTLICLPQRGLLPRHEAATDKAASATRLWPSAETSGYTSRATGR